jgi:NADH:ubiquinone oxidoreductase subunit 4 (subunit M)
LREETSLPDLGIRETLVMGVTVLLLLGLGLYPQAFLSPLGSLTASLAQMH